MTAGRLYHGDNVAVMASLDPASVQLTYLDPPFATGKNFGAYDDRWPWDARATRAERTLPKAAVALLDFNEALTSKAPRAYLARLGEQIKAARRVTSRDGTIVVHVDERYHHLIRSLAEVLVAPAVWINTVIWRYRRWPTKAKCFQKMHDVLMFFGPEDPKRRAFETLYGYEDLAESTLQSFGRKKQRADFSRGARRPGLDDHETLGPPLSDVWEVGLIAPSGKERRGYPTQKPEALLERVVRAWSAEGDLVLDAFTGSGTTLAVAERLKRRWIGIDSSAQAIATVERRLNVKAILSS